MYTALKETESRSTDLLPLWKVPLLGRFVPRQQKATAAVALIRKTTEDLIAKCRAIVDAEEQVQSCRPCLPGKRSVAAHDSWLVCRICTHAGCMHLTVVAFIVCQLTPEA